MKVKTIINALKSSAYAAMAVLLAGTVVSCSEETGGEFDPPKFVAEAAKYVIDDSYAEYASIELTESGNYIITPNQMANARNNVYTEGKKTWMLSLLKYGFWSNPSKAAATRFLEHSRLPYGKYTKTGDNEYTLEGYGTLTIKKDATGNSLLIVLTPTGKAPIEYNAHKMKADLNSSMSNKLCRTWEIEGYRYYIKENGKTLLNLSANSIEELVQKMQKWAEKNDPDFDPNDWEKMKEEIMEALEADNVVFTKTGTYVVFYPDDELAVSTWKWKNEKMGILHYCWDPDFIDDPDDGGDVRIEFKNGKLHLTELDEDEEDYEAGITFIMHEMK